MQFESTREVPDVTSFNKFEDQDGAICEYKNHDDTVQTTRTLVFNLYL